MDIAWEFRSVDVDGGGTAPAEGSHEVAHFQDDILTGTVWLIGPVGVIRASPEIVRGEQDDRVPNFQGVLFEFLDYRASLIRALVKDDGLETEPVEQPSHLLANCFVAAMDKENLLTPEGSMRPSVAAPSSRSSANA